MTEFDQLSPKDQKEALRLLNQYTVSRVMSLNYPRAHGNAMYRKAEAIFFRGLRSKLREVLGPGFPALARQMRVLKVLRGPA